MSPVRSRGHSSRTDAVDSLDVSGRLSGDVSALDEFARELGHTDGAAADLAATAFGPRRVNAGPATAEKDLGKLVLALVDLVRQLMERQALRRINAGALSDEDVERMGETFLRLDRKMIELRTAFGLQNKNLNLSLGPIRDLL
jgi:hypothetical protein